MLAPLERPPASDVITVAALAVLTLALLTFTNHRKKRTSKSNKKGKKCVIFLLHDSPFSLPTLSAVNRTGLFYLL
jgi:hypothetical protein